jgi:hypothetical protein
MSAPSITSSSPASGTTDIVLGTSIVIGFSQPMDTSTINSTTFSLTGPGQTAIIAPAQLISKNPTAKTGREYITGTFSFALDSNGNTLLTFKPSVPLRPNVKYTILVIGPGELASESVKNLNGENLVSNYEWSFTTGDLNVVVPPAQSPLPKISLPLDPSLVKITQRLWAVGNDLSQEIDITFPGPIDPNSVSAAQILLSIEPILNDPSVLIPEGLKPTVIISGNKISITISGWPLDN